MQKTKKKLLDELDFSVEYFDQLDVIKTKKNIKFLKKNQKIFLLVLKHQLIILMYIYTGQEP